MKTILLIQHAGHNLYVIAEPACRITQNLHLDIDTKCNIKPEELDYRITLLQDCKLGKFLGYVPQIEPGMCFLRKFISTTQTTPQTSNYKSERIFILQKIYQIKSEFEYYD